jgi:DNA excision repair protein ERCC-2
MTIEKQIKISVRELVEYAYLSGDLDARYVGMGRALEGSRLHQKLQGLRKEEADTAGGRYHREVSISAEIPYKELVFEVSGRIDGLIETSQGMTLEEIKTTMTPLEYINEDTFPVHWAQAKCYAYMYALQYHMPIANIQLTYYNADRDEQKVFVKAVDTEELERHFTEVLDNYYNWAYSVHEWKSLRDKTIKSLEFPYDEYRKNQRKLVVAVYKTIEASRRIFIQAPTGTGKTISALYPAVKALAEGHTSRVFYLTAKTITRQVALDAMSRMWEQGLRLRTVVLTAKEKLCFKEEAVCNPEYCEYARGYYDKINSVLKMILAKEGIITREIVEEYARQNTMCPFELSLDLAYWMDCIICDYNYVFDPRASLKRFFQDRSSDFVLLVDEAHNLVDRAREMFSAELHKKAFLEVKRLMKNSAPAVSKAAANVNTMLLNMKKSSGGKNCCLPKEELKELYPALKALTDKGDEWLSANQGSQGYQAVLELYFEVSAFLRIFELFDESYTAYIELERNDVRLKLFCLDPSRLLSEITGRMKASVFYSATLTPMNYFKDILGGSAEDYNMRLPSPFEHSNLCLAIAEDVSTRYLDRENSFARIAEYIKTVISSKEGNYLVFFPSYKYMSEVYSVFSVLYPEAAAVLQQPDMQEEEKESFLESFSTDRREGLVGFAVMGGMFSEGIDLAGDRLIGAVIVGVGLPQVCFERDIIMDYFKNKNNKGFEYAYMYPGMNKVMQAAGRVIRSERDRGVVLLIDERFGSSRYTGMFPEEWMHNKRVNNPAELESILEAFWKS